MAGEGGIAAPSHAMLILRALRDAAIFAPCYIALDWASYIDPVGPFNITPWNPQPALAIVWMLLGGLAHLPVVLATIFIADVIVRQAPGGYALNLATALVLAVGYGAIAGTLRAVISDAGLRTARDLTLFCATVLAGTAVVGAVFVGLLFGAAQLGTTPFGAALIRFWVGDAVGVLITAPLLLAAADAVRRSELATLSTNAEAILQVLVLAATVWVLFSAWTGDPARHFYALFLPLIWIAARLGMNGAIVAMAIVQVGVVLGIREMSTTLSIVELQALVAALSLTGLFLGVMVDERRRAEADLRQTIRLAAAGEMAGAIAHEVNQPLTALFNYGRSAQMLLAPIPGVDSVRAVVEKMMAEAERAGDVVRRLRDFFRSGNMRLEVVDVGQILAVAQRTAESACAASGIVLTVQCDDGLSPLFVDRLQIELVLRNLLANSIESIAATSATGGQIALRAARRGHREVLISVVDSGPGVPAAIGDKLFQPFVSGKPSGMGLGLAVSRAIVEAHGGSLVALPRSHGEFQLVLPCSNAI